MPVHEVQGAAEALLRDGVQHPGVKELGALGANGDCPGNVSRDFMRMCRRNGFLEVEPFCEEISIQRPGCAPELWRCPIILPHEIFHAFWSADSTQFQNRFYPGGEQELHKYWHMTRNLPWRLEHGYNSVIERNPECCVPIRLHGDEAPVTKAECLNVLNLSSCVSQLPSMFSRLLIWAFTAGFLLNFSVPLQILCWSLRCCAEGIMPHTDRSGQPFKKGSWRWHARGKPIAGGLRFILAQFVGDLNHFRDILEFDQHYGKESLCWNCHGVKCCTDLLCAYVFRRDAPWSFAPRTHASYMASVGHHVLWTQLPGWHLSLCQLDLMHIVCLGILQWCVGSIFFELCEANYFNAPWGGRWQVRWSYQLAIAFGEFKEWCACNAVRTSQPMFSTSALSLFSLQDKPFFKSKASNCWKVGRWLATVCQQRAASAPCAHNSAVAGTIFGYIRSLEICKASGTWLSDDAAGELETCRIAALECHAFLAHEAHRSSRDNVWVTKPKHHIYDETLRRACRERLNPGNHWCFADEDFVGKVVQISRFVGGGRARAEGTLRRYLLRLHCQFHQWTQSIPS